MKSWHLTEAEMTAALPEDAAFRFHTGLRNGSMRLGLYAPRGDDPEGPHQQDELYIILRGTGTLMRDGVSAAFGPHDALFVAAGTPHHFTGFTDDFACWVIFWGPGGGEGDSG
jgi:mannose-6-phosphate isomerase-like protein (cupin superfamily)